MEGSLQIGKLFGIPIRLHWSFLIVIPLFAWIIGSFIVETTNLLIDFFNLFFNAAPDSIDITLIILGFNPYILGTIVVICLFIGVLLHELAHSLVAQAHGIKINSITLLILGGVASMEEGIPDPKVEIPMALAGPLMSFSIGLACSAIALISASFVQNPQIAGLLFFIFGYLGLLNLILFGFNLLPAFPMDGGRVLRACLATRMPLNRATKIAADIGRAFAIVFAVVGIIWGSFLLIIIAIFIYIGAGQESQMVKYNVLLQDVSVSDAMSSPVVTIPPDLPVTDVIDMMYSYRHLGFPVVDQGALIGMVTLADVHTIPLPDREAMQVKDIMTEKIITLPPGSPLIEAMKIMSVKNIGRVPVLDNGVVVGIVTRTDILRVMELKEI